MPWQHTWVEPEVAFQVAIQVGTQNWKDINVYHTYKDDDWNERLTWWYTLHDGQPQTDTTHASNAHGIFDFDIREFPTYDESWDHHRILQTAIDTNLCTIEDIFIHTEKAHRGTNAEQ